MGFYFPQESFPTYYFTENPNDREVVDRACSLLGIDRSDADVDYEEWCSAVECVQWERADDLRRFEDVLADFNRELDFHEVILDDDVFEGCALFVIVNDMGGSYEDYTTDSQVMFASNRMAWKTGNRDYDWPANRLMGAVLKEEERIRDWLYEVPERYGFRLTSYPTEGDEYESFRAMSFGRKPKGRRL